MLRASLRAGTMIEINGAEGVGWIRLGDEDADVLLVVNPEGDGEATQQEDRG